MEIQKTIKDLIQQALSELSLSAEEISLEHPTEFSHGDYSSNIAMVLAKKEGMNPKELAEKIVVVLRQAQGDLDNYLRDIQIAGPGFINFYLSLEWFQGSLGKILKEESAFGKSDSFSGKKIMVEYTDPNPFKVFHIGHLMSNAIGESLARLYESGGAHVLRANYFGDVGLHVAKAIWGKMQKSELPWGEAYAYGAGKYEADEKAKSEIGALNKKVYDKSDEEVNKLYAEGRKETMDHFEEIYKVLGTKFDYYFPESEVAETGVQAVKENIGNVFEESDGAVVFPGEKYDLHTRVFLTSEGLPTYEAKELGLDKIKFEKEPGLEKSIIVTANEQSGFFKVVLKAMSMIFPEVAEKTEHVAHGMMSGLGGSKMSSRTGDVISGESLLADVREMALKRIKESEHKVSDQEVLADQIAVSAIKYTVLKQAPGKNITFDPEQALSFEGDSGPYLQYTYTRARSVLEKGESESLKLEVNGPSFAKGFGRTQKRLEAPTSVERLLYRFPEVATLALRNHAPHHVTNYLVELAREFNSFYGNTKIVDKEDETAPYKLAITKATSIVLKNGLSLLGVEAPERM